ncbi:hypothetical protein SCOR_28525 [Sulfidibacter corallicola]|uniref:Uncharacterized protein n=1 Tax=Sulfidibacter corallicola TaxID=2818388 RepID=A0A8A4TM07_SULCO|nr:hypothetical protein [Sulfidibacter corallicola]QTD50497.1 hypothetical protein J3U87_33350 [Sulfidibacter corallicola]
MRTYWPRIMMMHSCPLIDAYEQGRHHKVIDRFFPGGDTGGVPIALRWVTKPLYGFCRRPFRVFRRQRRYDDLSNHGEPILTTPISFNGTRTIEFDKPMFDVVFKVNFSFAHVDVVVQDDTFYPIAGQKIRMLSSGWGRFRTHGMCSIKFSGNCTVERIHAIDQNVMINLPDWDEPVQFVGFPYADDDIAAPAYHAEPQGYAGSLTDGLHAATQRLDIAALMQLDCPPIPGVASSPAWKAPDSAVYLQNLRDGLHSGESILHAVTACLNETDDYVYHNQQKDFVLDKVLRGINQVGQPATDTRENKLALPVVSTTLMNAATDSLAATGLGYGTIDFPPESGMGGRPTREFPRWFTYPPGRFDVPFDYMVSYYIHYLAPTGPDKDPEPREMDLAAIAEFRGEPEDALNLEVAIQHQDRPVQPDLPFMQARKLSWDRPELIQGWGIAAARAGQDPEMLNLPRSGGGYQPFIAQRALFNGGKKTHYLDKLAAQPITGQKQTTYHVIGTDVFGRWSDWSDVAFIAQAPDVKGPGIKQVTFVPYDPTDETGDLVIDFAWDWSDRSPRRIRFSGKFFAADGTTPGTTPPNFFALDKTTNAAPIVITFDVNQNPFKQSGPPAQVAFLEALDQDPNADVRVYRLTVSNVRFAFTATVKKLGYAVYAVGYEKIRPFEPSDPVGPATVYAQDPKPPALSFNLPDVTWTTPPDATGKGRVKLTWPPASNAVGYMVWYSSETALLEAANQAPPATIDSRAEACKNIVANAYDNQDEDAIRVFTRINDTPIPQTEFEAEVTSSSDILHLYRVSAVSATNVESRRSRSVFAVGIPKVVKPGRPGLLLRKHANGVKVVAIPGDKPDPLGFRVFRCRREGLTVHTGLMGAPIYDENAGWGDEQVVVMRGEPAVACKTLVDPLATSWYPYYYRITALGIPDLFEGHLSGESQASQGGEITPHPEGPPLLNLQNSVYAHKSNRFNIYGFTSDVPAGLPPLGPATIEVFNLVLEGQKTRRERIYHTHTCTLDRQSNLLPNHLHGFLRKKIYNKLKSDGPFALFYRSPTNAFPMQYRLFVETFDPKPPDGQPKVLTRILRITDPLGRSTEREIEQVLVQAPG